jgi:hypothetical protein
MTLYNLIKYGLINNPLIVWIILISIFVIITELIYFNMVKDKNFVRTKIISCAISIGSMIIFCLIMDILIIITTKIINLVEYIYWNPIKIFGLIAIVIIYFYINIALAKKKVK